MRYNRIISYGRGTLPQLIEIIIISLQYSIGIRQRAQNPAAARIKHEMIPMALTRSFFDA